MGYEYILGEDFNKLHPKIQDRYKHSLTKPFHGTGTMHVMRTKPRFLRPFYYASTKAHFLVPESGENIPFTISTNPVATEKDAIDIYWERTFFFPNVTRSFHTKLHIPLSHGSVIDYLGNPALASTEMHYYVTKEGFLMHLSGAQQALFGPWKIPLHRSLSGHGVVIDGYDDTRDVHTVKAFIANDWIGEMMVYSGEFRED